MVTQNHFVIPATVLEKFRPRGFTKGVTVPDQDCTEYLKSYLEEFGSEAFAEAFLARSPESFGLGWLLSPWGLPIRRLARGPYVRNSYYCSGTRVIEEERLR